MTKKHTVSEHEKALFRAAVKNIKPATHSPRANKSVFEAPFELYDLPQQKLNPDEFVFYQQPQSGLQHKLRQNLTSGKIPIENKLDLHGLTTTQAKLELSRYIYHCLKSKYRCVLLIHGKGKVLKNHTAHWLNQIPSVLAFCSAIPRHGGTGAVYILLKSEK